MRLQKHYVLDYKIITGEPKQTNEKRIMQEFEQLCAVMDMLADEGIILPLSDEERDAVHEEKVRAVKSWELFSSASV